jgi:hypothetical protein
LCAHSGTAIAIATAAAVAMTGHIQPEAIVDEIKATRQTATKSDAVFSRPRTRIVSEREERGRRVDARRKNIRYFGKI